MRAGIRISSLVPSGLVIESVSDSSDSIILAVGSEAGMANGSGRSVRAGTRAGKTPRR